MYAFTADKKFLILSLLIPFLLHGFYNFFAFPFNFFIVVGMLIYAVKLNSNLKKLQSIKTNEAEKLKI